MEKIFSCVCGKDIHVTTCDKCTRTDYERYGVEVKNDQGILVIIFKNLCEPHYQEMLDSLYGGDES